MKNKVFPAIAVIGSAAADFFGGWDTTLQTLVLFMVIDWITGGIILPVIFKKSPKSPNGTMESEAGYKGLSRKGMVLFYVLVATRLDLLLHMDYLRNTVCIGFIANETLSIVENAGLMGLPLPEGIKNGIDILKSNSDNKEKTNGGTGNGKTE